MEENIESNSDTKESLTKNEKLHQPLITFAKINKYFLIPFLCPVFCMMANYCIGKFDKQKIMNKAEFIVPVYVILSYVAAGTPYFISKFNQKVEGGKEVIIYRERIPHNIKYIYNKGFKQNLIKKYALIIFLSLLVVAFELLSSHSRGYKLFQERLYFMFLIPIFSKFILKDDIFKHQYFSLFIAILGSIFLIVPVGLKLAEEDIVPNIQKFFSAVAYSLYLVLIKYVTHTFYISPFKLNFIFGLISLGCIVIGYIIFSLAKFHDFSYFKDCLDFSEVDNKLVLSLYIIFGFIFAAILQFLTLLVIFYFSPILLMVTDIISPMLLWLVTTIEDGQDLPDVVLNPIGFVIMVFSSLIYNEIIIFNFCGLGENTKKFIEQRQNEESNELRKTENLYKLGQFGKGDGEGDSNDGGIEEDRFSNSS